MGWKKERDWFESPFSTSFFYSYIKEQIEEEKHEWTLMATDERAPRTQGGGIIFI